MGLKKVRAKAGCLGCYYENAERCPVDEQASPVINEKGTNFDFSICTEGEEAIIFVEDANE